MAGKQNIKTPTFPTRRMRRLRSSQVMRDMTADVTLSASNLILPIFVGNFKTKQPIESMPGVYQWPVDAAVRKIEELSDKGLKSFILFGITDENQKDPGGSFAASKQAPVNQVLAKVRAKNLNVLMFADLCFCEYTVHGHCGILREDATQTGQTNNDLIVDNDATIAQLGETAVAQAQAGADVIAPSGMMDGQVKAIRRALDDAGYKNTAILSYSIKYASCFYGPFRDAGGGHMQFGSRKGYQMDFRRQREWQDELNIDLAEGADMVMVKPALAYLDILQNVRQNCSVPIGAYQVSGEYASICAAAEKGAVDLNSAVIETIFAMRRAGADFVLTYFAEQIIDWLK